MNFFPILLMAGSIDFGPRFLINPPYSELEELLPFEPHGWYSNANTMERLIRERNVKVIIEVGSWLGTSTRHMASLVPPDGKVYAIDHWIGSLDHREGAPNYHPCVPHLYHHFLSNVMHAGLTEKIIPLRMDSLSAAKLLQEPGKLPCMPDLVYIDASHDYESALADIRAWYPFVKGKGILCGDDWGYASVSQAIKDFALEEGLSFEVSENCWILIDPLLKFPEGNDRGFF